MNNPAYYKHSEESKQLADVSIAVFSSVSAVTPSVLAVCMHCNHHNLVCCQITFIHDGYMLTKVLNATRCLTEVT